MAGDMRMGEGAPPPRYFGIYTDMPDRDIETALDTLAELATQGADDFSELSMRQLAVMEDVRRNWAIMQAQP